MKYKIALLKGDGIGPEVINEGIKVLNAVAELSNEFKFEFTSFPWGCNYYKETGRMMAENGIAPLPSSLTSASPIHIAAHSGAKPA